MILIDFCTHTRTHTLRNTQIDQEHTQTHPDPHTHPQVMTSVTHTQMHGGDDRGCVETECLAPPCSKRHSVPATVCVSVSLSFIALLFISRNELGAPPPRNTPRETQRSHFFDLSWFQERKWAEPQVPGVFSPNSREH